MLSLSALALGDVEDVCPGRGGHVAGCGQQHFQSAGVQSVDRSGPHLASSYGR